MDVIERAKKLEDQIDNDNDATSVERCASYIISELSTSLREKDKALKAVDDVFKPYVKSIVLCREKDNSYENGYATALQEIRKAIETGEVG